LAGGGRKACGVGGIGLRPFEVGGKGKDRRSEDLKVRRLEGEGVSGKLRS
jgi:hypothetical protein